ALELSWAHDGSPVFLSWTRSSRSSSKPEDLRVELCRQLGEKLGLRDGEQGFLRPCLQVSSVHQVFVEPLSSDDWEILELHSASLEQQLLDQIRVVFKGAVFPVWVDHRTAVYIRIATLEPAVPHGRLEQFTELVVSPKTRLGTDSLLRSPPGTSQKKSPPPYRHSTSDPALLPRPPSPPHPPGERSHDRPPPGSAQAQPWGGDGGDGGGGGGGVIADLKGLVRYLFTGARDPAAETAPAVPDVPALLPAAVHRVCHQPPNALCTINPGAAAVVHLFPWSETIDCSSGLTRSAVTYGLLSKVPSPQEARDGAKSAEAKKKKKKSTGAPKVGQEVLKEQEEEEEEEGGKEKEKEVAVVRVVCHHVEELQDSQNCGEVHAGRVWITQHLATSLKIAPHSMVRIQPVESTVRVASGVRLRPLEPLVSDMETEP
ncbi:hypothetical protein CRUP_014116, partial [Coryphaenoides rupestris]